MPFRKIPVTPMRVKAGITSSTPEIRENARPAATRYS
jgi:hypothetical protein